MSANEHHPIETETAYGDVSIRPHGVTVRAHGGQLWAWSHRTGSVWPCSVLEDLDALVCEFDSGGLVDLQVSTDDAEALKALGISSIPGDELSAWSSDVLRDVLPREHPAWFVCVGQFEDGAR